ncbi:MAG: hypothetical protein GXO45_00695 [Aquificae bacterium]|nr:hypothetical protein [Aquificota bacterium]
MEGRLRAYLQEAQIHIERLKDVLERMKPIYPLDKNKLETLTSIEMDMLDTLAFRFSKLQDLLGAKIFREFLNETGFITEGKTFWEILREIEKEGIIDIDTWSDFRKVRNFIAHDYPNEIDEKAEAINYLIEKTPILIEVVERIENKINRF